MFFVCSRFLNYTDMFDYSSNGVSLTLVRDIRKKDSTGKCPLRWRVTYKRKQVYYSTGMSLNPEEWELLINDSRKKEIKAYRESLQTYYDSTIQKQVKYLADNGLFSFDVLNIRLSKSAGDDLLAAFDLKIEQMKADGRIGNASFFQCAKNSLTSYTNKKLKISEITVGWLNGYYKHLIEKERPISFATAGMYLRSFRVLLNDARGTGLISESNYPFGKNKFIIPTQKGRDMSLELSEIKQIAEYQCPNKTMEMCRDLWIFSYLANGINFGDMLSLKYDNIDNGEIYFYRAKTIRTTKEKTKIIIPILNPMQAIIDKWGNMPGIKTYIFPFLNKVTEKSDIKREILNVIRLTNKQIKEVTSALKLPDISTYNARHSYATILAKNRVPESYISEALGHSKKSVTQGYFGSYSKQERIKYNSLLLW